MSVPKKQIFAAVATAITDDALMMRQIADKAGYCIPSVNRVISILHDNGMVHIARWEKVPHGTAIKHIAAYMFGPGVDAIKPGMTREQIRERKRELKRQYRARKIEAAKVDARIAAELARPAFRDPLVEAFYGSYRRAA